MKRRGISCTDSWKRPLEDGGDHSPQEFTIALAQASAWHRREAEACVKGQNPADDDKPKADKPKEKKANIAGLDFDAILKQIEAEILPAPYRKQEAMNCCLVEIGIQLPRYTQKCIALGERLGRFDPRPIPKGCVSTYAPEWIAAALKRKK